MKSQTAVLVHDDDYLPVLTTMLDTAKFAINIVAFSFAIGSGARSEVSAPMRIARQLLELKKQRRNLKIRLYLEGVRETADRNRISAAFLSKGGVEVRFGTTHAKGFSVDHKVVLFGSTNLTHQSITKNIETNLLLNSVDAVKGFELYFEHLWRGGGHGGIELPPPFLADGAFKEELLQLIDSAKHRLDFSIYFFHHTEIERALLKATKRGVQITGLIHNHRSFAMSFVRRSLATARRLRAGGVRKLYLGPTSLFTHSKFMVRDKIEFLLGTGNWLNQDVLEHPQLYIRLKNPVLAKDLTLELEDKIKNRGELLV